jgi:putative Mg2+ transporter-C (MgtC) family protein
MGVLDSVDPFSQPLSQLEIAARMGLALLLGALIGFEREVRRRPAGLRTHMLVALAAATFMIIALGVFAQSLQVVDEPQVDMLRVIEAVTAGVAFLAAGSIIVGRGRVAGLTTGASLWLTGALGLACGIGYYMIAGIAAGMALVVLVILRVLEDGLTKKRPRVRDVADDGLTREERAERIRLRRPTDEEEREI